MIFWRLISAIKELKADMQTTEEGRAAQAVRKPQKSWAHVARAKGMAVPSPTKCTEIIVVPDMGEAEVRRRKGPDTLRAVKDKTGNPGAIEGARKLPDGSTVLRVAAGKEGEILQNNDWIPVVFGKRARVAKGGLQVLAKGIPNGVLSAVADDEIREASGAFHATRKAGSGGYGTLLCRVPGIETAGRLTREGIRLRGEVFRCEPFCRQGRARQCFNCAELGHIARQCHREARCLQCAKKKHVGPCTEDRCSNCKGKHPATARDVCPVAQTHRDDANRIFRDRPRHFAKPAPATTPRMAPAAARRQDTRPADASADASADAPRTRTPVETATTSTVSTSTTSATPTTSVTTTTSAISTTSPTTSPTTTSPTSTTPTTTTTTTTAAATAATAAITSSTTTAALAVQPSAEPQEDADAMEIDQPEPDVPAPRARRAAAVKATAKITAALGTGIKKSKKAADTRLAPETATVLATEMGNSHAGEC